MRVEIQEGPVYSRIDRPELVSRLLSYDKVWWEQGPYSKVRRSFRKGLVTKKGRFLSGFLSRVVEFLEMKGHEVVVHGSSSSSGELPELPGIEFREDQEKALRTILASDRGVWTAPTGSGKTILIAALVKAYSGSTIVVLVHTKALLKQTMEELEKFGLADDYVDVRMKQSFSNAIGDLNPGYYRVVIVDEAHHVSSFDGQYARILRHLEASVRIGFTATTYEERSEAHMAMEGLLGPVLGATTYREVSHMLARPRMKFVRVPDLAYEQKKKLRGRYKEVYEGGIVRNRKRNQLIVEEAERCVGDGRSVLIMVEQLEHGRLLLELLEVAMPGTFAFICAEDGDEKLDRETRDFKSGKRKGIVSSRIWGEGVNIKRITAVINAVGGKSEIASIQRFGRGLRSDEGKTDVLLIDFLDTNHSYFQRHSIERLCFYSEVGWI